MDIPGFNAETSIGPATKSYRTRKGHGTLDLTGVSPQQDELDVLEDEIEDEVN